ncbi:MAG: sugar phosphate isomerase/epimerase [Armatimonadetes bacterium]|nr:sugar phosphate isomerase/epimerase [Armatimonadota bacterium]
MDIGVTVMIHDDTDFAQAFAEARDAGFSHGQVTIFVPGITADEVREIALAAHTAKFHVDAVGCYMNPLRPDEPSPQETTRMDWKTVAENMGMLNGVERIVCWSGTLGKTLGTPNLLNQENSTFNNLYIALSGLFEQVRGLPIQIVLEPYSAHVLSDAASCVRMAKKFPSGALKVVLDAPNILSVKEFTQWDARVEEFVRQVTPAVGLVHLKDVSRGDGGHRVFLPPGQGALDYGRYLRAVAQHAPDVPVILENVRGGDEMRAAREFIESTLKEHGL